MCCDLCSGEHHRPTNVLCSASLGASVSPLKFGIAYAPTTKEAVLHLSINNCIVVEQIVRKI